MEKTVKKSIRTAKRKFEKKLAANAKKDPKAFYTYLKSKTANRESVGPLKEDGENAEFIFLLSLYRRGYC